MVEENAVPQVEEPVIKKIPFERFGKRKEFNLDLSDYTFDSEAFASSHVFDPDTEITPSIFNVNQEFDGYDQADVAGFDEYIAEMRKYPLLNRELEQIIFTHREKGGTLEDLKSDPAFLRAFESADPEKLQHLLDSSKTIEHLIVLTNMRMVVTIANRFKGLMPMAEMVQVGFEGLFPAIEGFKIEKGNKFSTYSGDWIAQRIRRAAQETGRGIRLPVYVFGVLNSLRTIADLFFDKYSRNPYYHELVALAAKNGMAKVNLDTIIHACISGTTGEPVSLFQPVGEDGETVLLDLVQNRMQQEKDFTNTVDLVQSREMIIERIATIIKDTRMRDILHERLGLNGTKKSLQALGDELGVTRSRVEQLEKKGVRILAGDTVLVSLLHPDSEVGNKQ